MRQTPFLRYLVMIICLIAGLASFQPANAATKPGQFNGLTLDVARHHYQIQTLKKFIHQVKIDHGQFVQLHLTDSQSFAIENETVGQTLTNAIESDGVWRNRTTHQAFYSKAQIATLLAYAKQQQVTLIPEIDTPAHLGGLVATLKANHQQELVQQLITQNHSYGPEFKLTNASIDFVSQIDAEVARSFIGQANARFHLGGDEFTDNTKPNPAYVTYLNRLAANVEQLGFIPEAWNDGFLTHDLATLDHQIQVTYWNWTADEKGAAGRARKQSWATMPQLIHHGFKVLNYNDYYLYFNVTKANLKPANVTYMSSDMKQNWDPTIWDNDAQSSLNSLHGITGSSISIWCESDKTATDKQIYQSARSFLKNFLALARQPI